MNCKTCNEPAPQHELVGGECLRCVARERDKLREALEVIQGDGHDDPESCCVTCQMVAYALAPRPVDKPPTDELVCQPAANPTAT